MISGSNSFFFFFFFTSGLRWLSTLTLESCDKFNLSDMIWRAVDLSIQGLSWLHINPSHEVGGEGCIRTESWEMFCGRFA